MQNRIQVESYNRVQYRNSLNKMRSLLFFACILACVYLNSAENLRTKLREAVSSKADDAEACIDEVGMTREIAFEESDIVNKVYLQPGMEERRRKNGCFVACALKKLELMDESGVKEQKIHSEISKRLSGHREEAKAHKIAHDCVQQAKDLAAECEIGFKLMECVGNEIHKLLGHGEHDGEHEEHNEHEEHTEHAEQNEHEEHNEHEK